MAELESKTIHSVAKAIHLLDLLTAGGQPASLTELYQKTGWPKSTIHGLLSTMREAGLIEQNANGRYWLGIRLFEYGCAVSNAWDISAIARPYMQELSDALGESVFLSVLDRAAVVTLAEVESRASLRVVSEVGARLPIHCTSQGKLFLAFGTQAEARRILTRGVLEAHTPRTLTSYEAFCRSWRRSAHRATLWSRRNISPVCGRSPRRCEMHPVRFTRWAALGWVIRAITTTRQRARSACAMRRWPCRGRLDIAARKNLSFFKKGLDILAYCRYNYPCCLSRRYSSVGRAADL